MRDGFPQFWEEQGFSKITGRNLKAKSLQGNWKTANLETTTTDVKQTTAPSPGSTMALESQPERMESTAE